MMKQPSAAMRFWISAVASLFILVSGPPRVLAQGSGDNPGYALTPISGADGAFETVQEDVNFPLPQELTTLLKTHRSDVG